MLQLDIAGMMNDREIANHYLFLTKNGFAHYTASRLINNKFKSISFAHLSKLCLLLRCTPNDLLIWKSDVNENKNVSQPVQQLKPIIIKPLLSTRLQHLPIDKLREIKKAIDDVIKSS
jgi:DNA-binding Xre family transcriptional regulator